MAETSPGRKTVGNYLQTLTAARKEIHQIMQANENDIPAKFKPAYEKAKEALVAYKQAFQKAKEAMARKEAQI